MRAPTAGRVSPGDWIALVADIPTLALLQALRVSPRTLATWRARGAPWWAVRIVQVDIHGGLPLRAEPGLAECRIDRDGLLQVPALRRSIHAGDMMAVQLLPGALSALRREECERQRQAKRLALMERDIRIVRQLGLIGLTSDAP